MFAAVLDKGELALLTNVTEMPEAVFKFICARNTRYKQQHSLTAGFTYYANTCECGTNFGDHYLFSEPGGAFFPMTDEDAAAIEIETMPFTEPLKFDSSYGMGIGDHILKHAKRR
ncbi:MAG: hypothetical protein ING69_02585 [Rhodocyclaceae bacterium]|nr:hypothetical protein [Rhodocyclaceae bacterium]MCA3081523.1 hypothetical protein [Rhodocyclaceae bacterium]